MFKHHSIGMIIISVTGHVISVYFDFLELVLAVILSRFQADAAEVLNVLANLPFVHPQSET